jgi:hypothetical protein
MNACSLVFAVTGPLRVLVGNIYIECIIRGGAKSFSYCSTVDVMKLVDDLSRVMVDAWAWASFPMSIMAVPPTLASSLRLLLVVCLVELFG